VVRLLEDLELGELRRLVVYNKIDLVEPAELRLLERSNPDAAFVSATHRETTRHLIERIARELAEKWERSARGPSLQPEANPSLEEEGIANDESAPADGGVTTVEEMLRAAGKRVRSRRARPSRSVA
jgi:50S ribosomal subunit-associated GTPase HflX